MKNLILALVALTLLSNCGAPIAMVGTASTSAASGNLSRSAFTSVVSVGMKKTTGSLPAEHIMNEFKKEINKNAKDKVEILNQKKDKLKNQVVEVKENIIINSRIKFLNVNP